ncbi:DUF4372 domain-containing protein [Virgibacillus pantothenticus]|uniref:DUF4372 domain-containing protein n=1 Tax=Virgibacillus pantothenticus TaxID=1473 RepID=UPI0028169D43|nr:DUF4372 domain-containing protein [Virgibacillus pantothenticus]MEB5453561.1 DUF4372 domain-containing protein [Virgibacillus pantothenticus]MEB5461924.1 DUF4372 domain-containing protein [Virgibacillus pantothenticus]MEB5466083.1 DUF4372 domain-containing protein [Virgibacillus pantothenticus]
MTVFKEYIHPLDSKKGIQKMIDYAGADKYVKKLDVLTFINMFIYAQLKGLDNLKGISDTIKRKKTVQRLVGIESINKSQLSRKNRERHLKFSKLSCIILFKNYTKYLSRKWRTKH